MSIPLRQVVPVIGIVLASCAGKQKTPPAPMAEQAAASSAAPRSEQPGQQVQPAAQKADGAPKAPLARREEIVETLHGTPVADPYRWLEDVKSPEVQAWMAGQDAAARAQLHAFPGRDRLAKRFRELFYVDSVGAPRKRGGRFFFTRTHADKEKAIVYWKDGEKGAEKVLLDPNQWSADGTVSLGVWVPSWDGKKVVYAQKANAADEATLHVLDVESGTVSEVDVIPGGKYAGPSWTPDSKGFYYEFLPTDPSIPVADRPGYTELRFHALGTDAKSDPLVRPRTGDPSTFLGGNVSRDGRWLFASVQRGWNENDLYLRDLTKAPLAKGTDGFELLVQGKDATYTAEAWKDELYVLTDEGAPRKRVFKVSLKAPQRKNWKEIVREDKDATIEDVSIIGGRLFVTYLRKASGEIAVFGLDGKPVRKVTLPGIGSVHGVVGNPDEDDAYFAFSSFTTPMQVYKTGAQKGGQDLWAKVQLPIDPSRFTVEQVFYPSKDGTPVSMFLVHATDLRRDGTNPTLLYGYGGFDVSLTPNFRASIYPWLEAGGVYAVANLRGGGEYGKEWHDAGKGHKKQNVFDDFAAAAEWLQKQGYTSQKKLAIYGGSNGGLLTGALMTQRPELYGAVVCAVPLLDMVRYHLFGSGKTWIPEYGTAERADDFATLYAYSPYHHVTPGTQYPPLLMLSADNDDRVDPLHARKFVAQVQASGSSAPTLLRIEKNAGHGGADQVKQAIEQNADMYAFLFHTLGVQLPAGEANAQK